MGEEEKFVQQEILELNTEYPFAKIEDISDFLKIEDGEMVLKLWENGIPLKNAYFAVFTEEVKDNLLQNSKNDFKQKMLTAKRSTPGSLSGGEGMKKVSYKDMSKDEFDRVLKKALQGDLKRI